MNRLEDDRYAGHQALFSISSLETSFPSRLIKCKSEEVQHAATITKPPKRSRPRRRRLSMHRVPISLTTILLSIVMALSVLCKPTEAAHNPGSQSRAVKGHFVDGRILFDRNLAPLPGLRRRDDQASTDTASATTTPEVAASSSSSDATTTKTLPTAFDGGFGTNYTQPSCPTFLRSMINNATFASCVPFSLLLQVCRSSPLPSKKIPISKSLTSHPPRTPCPSSARPGPSPPSPPSSTSRAPSPSPPAPLSCPLSPSPSAPAAPAKPTTTAKTRRCAKPTPASSPTTSPTTPLASKTPQQHPAANRRARSRTTITITVSPTPSPTDPPRRTATSITYPSALPCPPAACPPAIHASKTQWPSTPPSPPTKPNPSTSTTSNPQR